MLHKREMTRTSPLNRGFEDNSMGWRSSGYVNTADGSNEVSWAECWRVPMRNDVIMRKWNGHVFLPQSASELLLDSMCFNFYL